MQMTVFWHKEYWISKRLKMTNYHMAATSSRWKTGELVTFHHILMVTAQHLMWKIISVNVLLSGIQHLNFASLAKQLLPFWNNSFNERLYWNKVHSHSAALLNQIASYVGFFPFPVPLWICFFLAFFSGRFGLKYVS